jgi:hypothetical protein
MPARYHAPMHRAARLLAALLIIVLAAACSSPSGSSPSDGATATSSVGSEDGSGSSPSDEAASPATDDEALNAWRRTVVNRRGMDGEQFEYDCPAGGEPFNVWGTDLYTDDSSVCTAAVHAGAITLEEGGAIVIEIRPGEDEYEGSERNGIESLPYDAWGGSFVVVDE